MNITIINGKISTKLYDKHNNFSFFFSACQTLIATLHHVFHGTVMSEFLWSARSSFSVIRFYEKTSALITYMEKQGGNREKLTYKINMKAYGNDQLVFQKCDVSNRDILTFKWHSHLLPCLLENIWQERIACPMSKIFKFGIFAKIVSLYQKFTL